MNLPYITAKSRVGEIHSKLELEIAEFDIRPTERCDNLGKVLLDSMKGKNWVNAGKYAADWSCESAMEIRNHCAG